MENLEKTPESPENGKPGLSIIDETRSKTAEQMRCAIDGSTPRDFRDYIFQSIELPGDSSGVRFSVQESWYTNKKAISCFSIEELREALSNRTSTANASIVLTLRDGELHNHHLILWDDKKHPIHVHVSFYQEPAGTMSFIDCFQRSGHFSDASQLEDFKESSAYAPRNVALRDKWENLNGKDLLEKISTYRPIITSIIKENFEPIKIKKISFSKRKSFAKEESDRKIHEDNKFRKFCQKVFNLTDKLSHEEIIKILEELGENHTNWWTSNADVSHLQIPTDIFEWLKKQYNVV